jgi:peptidoglycan/LPS O-acetylase OafA/YrhL
MTAGYFYLHKSISKSAVKYFAYAAGLFFLVYPLVVPSFMYVGHHNGLFAPLFALVILYVLNSENYINTFLRLKIFTLCGKASYGVYLLQVPVYWFTYLTYKELGVFDFLGEEFRFYIFLIVLIATSVLSYYLFEKKVMLILRKKLLK